MAISSSMVACGDVGRCSDGIGDVGVLDLEEVSDDEEEHDMNEDVCDSGYFDEQEEDLGLDEDRVFLEEIEDDEDMREREDLGDDIFENEDLGDDIGEIE